MGSWLGKYDVIFPGAQIRVDSYEKWRALDGFLTGHSPDYYLPINSSLTPSEKGSRFLYNSTYFHECRHVLDYALCPSLTARQATLFVSGLYGFGIMDLLHYYPGIFDVIPNPLVKWIRLSPSEKKEYLSSWGYDPEHCIYPDVYLSSDTLVDQIPPVSDPSNIKSVVESLLAQAYCSRVQFDSYDPQYQDPSGKVYSTSSILESSALLTQLAAIAYYYGKEGKDFARNLITRMAQPGSQVYLDALFFVASHLISRGFKDDFYKYIPFILHWALLCQRYSFAYPSQPPISSNPAFRLFILLTNSIIEKDDLSILLHDPIAVYNQWQDRLGLDKIDLFFGSEILESIRPRIERTSYTSMLLSPLLNSVICFKEKVTKTFSTNPTGYINPAAFIKNPYSYPDIPVRFIYSKQALKERNSDKKYSTFLKSFDDSSSSEIFDVVDAPRFPVRPGTAFLHPESEDIILSGEKLQNEEAVIRLSELLLSGIKDDLDEQCIRDLTGGTDICYIF